MEQFNLPDRDIRARDASRLMQVYATEESSGMIGFMMRKGIVKSRRAGEILCVIISIISIALGAYLMLKPDVKRADTEYKLRLVRPENGSPYFERIRQ